MNQQIERFNRDVKAIIDDCGTYHGEIEGRKFSIEFRQNDDERYDDNCDGVFVGWFADDHSVVTEDETPYDVWSELWSDHYAALERTD